MPKTTTVRTTKTTVAPEQTEYVTTTETPQDLHTKTAIFRTYQVVWYVLGVIETLIGLRFLFKLLGASIASAFVQMLYGLSGVFVNPFLGIFPVAAVDRSVFEWASLVAMLIYALLAYGIVYLFQLVKPTNVEEVDEVVDNP